MKKDFFEARRLAIVVTLKCTLRCKLCSNCVPMYQNAPIIPKENLLHDIESSFKIFDKIQWIQLVGGELFLHPDLAEVLKEIYKYSDQFEKLIIMTNATMIPKSDVIEELKLYQDRCQINISDYGELSYKLNEFTEILKSNNIPYRIKAYHGDMQHYGGWVDNTNSDCRNYTSEQLNQIFDECYQIGMNNWHVYNGKLHNCIRSLFFTDLGLIQPRDNEYVDLNNGVMSIEKKRNVIRNFDKHPLTACNYCSGFNPQKSKRYPAAEQI